VWHSPYIVDAFATFKKHTQRSFSQKQSGDPDHAPFGEKFFTLGVGLAIVDPLAKFKECSFIPSRNMRFKILKRAT